MTIKYQASRIQCLDRHITGQFGDESFQPIAWLPGYCTHKSKLNHQKLKETPKIKPNETKLTRFSCLLCIRFTLRTDKNARSTEKNMQFFTQRVDCFLLVTQYNNLHNIIDNIHVINNTLTL